MTLREAYTSRSELVAHLLAGAIAAPLVWFVIGPVWIAVINRIVDLLP